MQVEERAWLRSEGSEALDGWVEWARTRQGLSTQWLCLQNMSDCTGGR